MPETRLRLIATHIFQMANQTELSAVRYHYLNINEQFERKVEDKVLLTGDSGIIAVGQGRFTFDNLAFFDLPY